MAYPVTYTLEQYTALVGAIAQGAMIVKYADKEVQYRSLADMYQIRRDMEQQLFPTPVPNSTRKYAEFSKGLYPNTNNSFETNSCQ